MALCLALGALPARFALCAPGLPVPCSLVKLADCQGAWLENRENGSFTATPGVFSGQLRCAGDSEKLLHVL